MRKGVGTRDAIKHPTVQRKTPVTKKYLTHNVNSADIEKPSLEYVKFKAVGQEEGGSSIEELEYKAKTLPKGNGCITEFKA